MGREDSLGSENGNTSGEGKEEVGVEQSSIKDGYQYTFANDEWDGDYYPSFDDDSHGEMSPPRRL